MFTSVKRVALHIVATHRYCLVAFLLLSICFVRIIMSIAATQTAFALLVFLLVIRIALLASYAPLSIHILRNMSDLFNLYIINRNHTVIVLSLPPFATLTLVSPSITIVNHQRIHSRRLTNFHDLASFVFDRFFRSGRVYFAFHTVTARCLRMSMLPTGSIRESKQKNFYYDAVVKIYRASVKVYIKIYFTDPLLRTPVSYRNIYP